MYIKFLPVFVQAMLFGFQHTLAVQVFQVSRRSEGSPSLPETLSLSPSPSPVAGHLCSQLERANPGTCMTGATVQILKQMMASRSGGHLVVTSF